MIRTIDNHQPVPDITISVALVTRNRPESLNRCLMSLRSQSIQPFEVVVSDDSDPEFAAETELIVKRWNCQYISGPRRGLYANRNHAALACKGTHIRTMDDDHEFPEKHFEQCMLAIKSDPEAIWIIGEYLPTEKVGQQPHPCPGQLHPRGFSVKPKNTQNCWAISDGASIYPKVIFDSGIRYAEYFKFGYSYLEFGSRLYWLGYSLRHLESTYIIHYYDKNNRSVMSDIINLSSCFYAILCHSFIYQNNLINKVLSILEISKQIVKNRQLGFQSLAMALRAYKKQEKMI
ncbi:MAG: glycosyltransferase family 2 protein [Moorea sp. SIO4A3]|nr:glycosyltransferase family 2 protein [Moorena sp. SIO4A3]